MPLERAVDTLEAPQTACPIPTPPEIPIGPLRGCNPYRPVLAPTSHRHTVQPAPRPLRTTSNQKSKKPARWRATIKRAKESPHDGGLRVRRAELLFWLQESRDERTSDERCERRTRVIPIQPLRQCERYCAKSCNQCGDCGPDSHLLITGHRVALSNPARANASRASLAQENIASSHEYLRRYSKNRTDTLRCVP